MSTHNLCFGAKIRKIGIPLQAPVLHIKVGFMGVNISRTCYSDENGLSVWKESYLIDTPMV